MARATNCDLLLKICTEVGKMRGDRAGLSLIFWDWWPRRVALSPYC